jgi:hypothetical protein
MDAIINKYKHLINEDQLDMSVSEFKKHMAWKSNIKTIID